MKLETADDRINVRISKREKKIVKRTAARAKATLSEFVLDAVRERVANELRKR